MGTYHSVELPFVFGLEAWPRLLRGGLPDDLAAGFSRRVVGYWTSFARTGNPNTPGWPEWPAYTKGQTIARLLPDETLPMPGYRQKQCAYWAQNSYHTLPEHMKYIGKFSASAGVPIDFLAPHFGTSAELKH